MKLEFDVRAPFILLDVFLENQGIQKKVRMALDTGSTYVLIPWEIAGVLNLMPELSTEKVETATASGMEKAPLVKVARFSVLGKEWNNVPCIVHDLPTKGYVDGVVGLSFLKHFDLRINFKEGFLELN